MFMRVTKTTKIIWDRPTISLNKQNLLCLFLNVCVETSHNVHIVCPGSRGQALIPTKSCWGLPEWTFLQTTDSESFADILIKCISFVSIRWWEWAKFEFNMFCDNSHRSRKHRKGCNIQYNIRNAENIRNTEKTAIYDTILELKLI